MSSTPDWVRAMQASFPLSPLPKGDYKECSIDSENDCNLSDMQRDTSTVVYPGGETRCIFSDSGPFGFQVIPGDSDKLLFDFQGGGACWDWVSTEFRACSTSANPSSQDGWFDRSKRLNPFQNYTVVHVLYCSGDLHAGNVTREYKDKAGEPVVQIGHVNTMSVLRWAKRNLKSHALSSLIIGGCSAGSVATQLWASTLLEEFTYERAAVIADSFAMVFPPGSEGPLMNSYGLCDVYPALIKNASLLRECAKGTLEFPPLYMDAMKRNPSVAFSNINSKYDSTQRAYYSGVAATDSYSFDPFVLNVTKPLFLTTAEFCDGMNEIFKGYNELDNYISFVVTSSQHCYTPYSLMYTATTMGTDGGQSTATTLVEWLQKFPVSTGDSQDSECDGPVLDEVDWTGDDYCDASQYGKIFTQTVAAGRE